MPRENKKSYYIRPDLDARFTRLLVKYPNRSRSEFVNAALEFYLPYAERGLDGNLFPYTLDTGPRIPEQLPMMTGEQILDALKQLIVTPPK